ncbi:UDP-2-acetamido-2,6-beta-L-arabino-hexul-4-ose reductase [Tsuneonella suprasediminis]|uniref:UDP-2-acetamido-2,6-beta-L-arabino-hexul-4-ose reductase n=1 Tax=Tsuneonella suprasediminis TaxID=2306996 RepID=UPI001F0C2D95|nr:NAD-dependent epimerase/dehydratase family protein [Tsuneonella suprasediminis]
MTREPIRILITGANGFVGRNLSIRLQEINDLKLSTFSRDDTVAQLKERVSSSDVVIHLAAENRPEDPNAFDQVNTGLTTSICQAIEEEFAATGRRIALLFTSSTQAACDNPYGKSKLAAEEAIRALTERIDTPAIIFRLPGVFGKWCRPNYNSVVATFCHNIARSLPIRIDDPNKTIRLVYIDDVVEAFLPFLHGARPGLHWGSVSPEYEITLGRLAHQISAFPVSRETLLTDRVGTGLTRCLYATYLSYLPSDRFAYDIPSYGDERGVFVEMLKTADSGQFSFFTAKPGIIRGRHYHHTKTEKFLVMQGQARFRFRHLLSNEAIEITTSGQKPQIVESIPGWSHDVTNVGDDELIVMLWANEIFDRERPDTIPSTV